MLTIVDADADRDGALAIYDTAVELSFHQGADAGMGYFWVSRSIGLRTALLTSGASSCAIIIVRTMNGDGALGHYPGNDNPRNVLAGLEDMLRELDPGDQVDEVLFAAAHIGTDSTQAAYERALTYGASQLAWGAFASASGKMAHGGRPCAAVFLPDTGHVALFDDLPGRFAGRMDAGNGLSRHQFLR